MKLVADLHIHTVASGHAFSTVDEIARAAAEKGLELIAITDHGPGLPGGAHGYHFWNLRVIPDEMHGVRILKGVEANVMDLEGHLDLSEELLEHLDFVGIGFHPRMGFDDEARQTYTQTLIKAMQDPYVDVIVHPGNPQFPLDMRAVVEAAARRGVALEVNNSSFSQITSRHGARADDLEMVRLAAEKGVDLVIGSDAHIALDVGRFDHALELVEEAGFPEERVLNTSTEKVLEFLRGHGKRV